MAVRQVNENTLDFIFDNSVDFFEEVTETLLLNCAKIYVIDNQNNYILLDGDNFNISFYCQTMSGSDAEVKLCWFDLTSLNESGNTTNIVKPDRAALIPLMGTLLKNIWVKLGSTVQDVANVQIQGFRVEDYIFADGQTLASINNLLTPYIGSKTKLTAKDVPYILRVNGKILNTLNGKILKYFTFNDVTYEIGSGGDVEEVVETTLNLLIDSTYTTSTFTLNFTKKDDQTTTIYVDDTLINTFSTAGAQSVQISNLAEGIRALKICDAGKIEFTKSIMTRQDAGSTKTSTGNTEIESITFGSNYGETIGSNAFEDASRLTKVILPSSVKQLGSNAFDSCISLVNVGFNNGLESIAASCFLNCTALTKLVIPSSVNNIASNAFTAAANNEITFKHSEADTLTLASQIFYKPKNAVAMTVKHYGNPSVLNYNWSKNNITPTFVDLRG